MNGKEGLSTQEALERLKKYGYNTLPEEKFNSFFAFLRKFWAPIPWILGIIIILEMSLGKYVEGWIIFVLLVFNGSLSFFEEGRARNALRLLRSRLNVRARALRDNEWKLLPAQELVPGDIIRVRMGDIIPADAEVFEGDLLVDQSALTGESMPIETSIDGTVFAGSIVKHGEASAVVKSTGKNTYYGKTAEILQTSKTPSHLQRTIFLIVKYLIIADSILVAYILVYSLYKGFPPFDIIPFSLLLLVASVPVALPAMYALATALGSIHLAKSGVLVTRLSAIEEAAAMNVLCLDKTGTITQNTLVVSSLQVYPPYEKEGLLTLASFACEAATQDPLDLAILKSAKEIHSRFSLAVRKLFIPFDPERKCSEVIIEHKGISTHVLKGAPLELQKLTKDKYDLSKDLDQLSKDGSRIVGVLAGAENHLHLVGLIALQDPPREDSKSVIQEICNLGIKVIMMTGDGATTAGAIASNVGIGKNVLVKKDLASISGDKIAKSDVIAEIYPEDKFHIIQALQKEGYICGMTGDGVNDAPALKQAEVGIAVSNATDVAKSSASLVLTNPGLKDILGAIRSSRRIYQRMLTYTLNKIIKTLEIAILLGIGFILTDTLIISQVLIVLLLFANDFATMSISTDNVTFSPKAR